MTTYRAFFRVLLKNISVIIVYTVILIVCMIGNTQNSKSTVNFTASRPDVTVYDRDESVLSKKLMNYISDRADIVELDTEEKLNDALYYDGTDYVIYIDRGFGEQISRGEMPVMTVKSEGNYSAFLSETILSRFLKVAGAYAPADQEEIAGKLDDALSHETKVEMTSKLDVTALGNAERFYNFMNYAILAGLVFAVAYSTAAFKRKMVRKRMAASSTDYKTINRQLIIGNLAIALVLLAFYVALSFLMVGDIMLSTNGILFVANAAVLSLFAVSFAFLLTNLLSNNNAILAIVNVVSIGSCFVCGVFVPASWMPEFVRNLGRALPSYYYVENNLKISQMAEFNFDTLKPVLINAAIILGITAIVIILNNIVVRRKQRE